MRLHPKVINFNEVQQQRRHSIVVFSLLLQKTPQPVE
jgi:hypothetical protein